MGEGVMRSVMDSDYKGSWGDMIKKVTFGQKFDGSSTVAMEIFGRKSFKVEGEMCSECTGIFEKENPVAVEVR